MLITCLISDGKKFNGQKCFPCLFITSKSEYFSHAREILIFLDPESHVIWTNLEVCACQEHEKKSSSRGELPSDG